MPYDFSGKVVLITGAGSGIGLATAEKLAQLGASLALSDIDASGQLRLGMALGERDPGQDHKFETVDVRSPISVQMFVQGTFARFGKIDHVFNCAGVNPTDTPLADTTDEYWHKLVDTNLKGIFNVTRAAIPYLKGGASFVNVSSIMGLHPAAGNAVYCATKYGVIGFSKSMALELGPKGIRTNIICPGYIETPTNSAVVAGEATVRELEQRVASGRFGTPWEVAGVVAFLFSDDSIYMNGSVVEVNGGTG